MSSLSNNHEKLSLHLSTIPDIFIHWILYRPAFFHLCIFSILAFFLFLHFFCPCNLYPLHFFTPCIFLSPHFFYSCIFSIPASFYPLHFFISEYILIVLWLHFSILAFFNFYPWNLYPCNYIPAFFIFLQFLSLCFAYIHLTLHT